MKINDFLTSVGKVPIKQIKYYLIWISKYNTYKKRYKQNSDQDYLESLSRKHQDWQIIQAQKAVNLYKYYLSTHTNQKEKSVVSVPDSWNIVEERIRESCKFQYKSYSTEKSYLYWTRTFGKYLDNKNPDTVSEVDIKNFLIYLAVQKGLAASTQIQTRLHGRAARMHSRAVSEAYDQATKLRPGIYTLRNSFAAKNYS